MSDPMTQIQEQINGLKNDLENLQAETVGDRNNIETFKRTLRGRIESLEESAEKLVTMNEHLEVKEIAVKANATLERLTKVIERAITAILVAMAGGLGLWLFNRIMGGP